MSIKVMVRGNYRKTSPNSNQKTLAPYEIEVEVAEVRPDFIHEAVQALLPTKVEGYSSLQTAYADLDSMKSKAAKKPKASKKDDEDEAEEQVLDETPATANPVEKVDEEGEPLPEEGDIAFNPDEAETLSGGVGVDAPPAFEEKTK